MAIRKGLPAKLALTDADDTRYLFSGLLVCNVDGSPRGGVLSPVGTSLVTATATMSVSVARFQGAAVRDGGVVLLANDGAVNVLLDAAPGANSRIDVIYAKQNGSSATVAVPDANNTPVLGFVKGTAGAIPVKPSLPAGALELATVEIPSGATATNSGGVVITQTAQFTTGSGGVVPFRTKAALDLWTTASSKQSAVVIADGSRYEFNGAAWGSIGIFRFAGGSLPGVTVVPNGLVRTAVVFPVGKFTLPPLVSPIRTDTAREITVAVENVTTAGFDFLRGHSASTGTTRTDVTAAWTAIQVSPTSAG